MFLALRYFPLIYGFYSSFFEIRLGFGEKEFVGLKNYFEMLTSSRFLYSIFVTMAYTAGSVGLGLAIGFSSALIMNSITWKGKLLRAVILAPWVVSPVVAALSWKFFLDPNFGFLNDLLYRLGILAKRDGILWISDKRFALLTCVVIQAWLIFPFMSLILLAALKSIPKERYEAALVDGAGPVQTIFYITLPSIRLTLFFLVLFGIITCFNMFDLIWVLTRGGPVGSTEVLALFVYRTGLRDFRLGAANAVGIIMFLMLLVIGAVYSKIYKPEEV